MIKALAIEQDLLKELFEFKEGQLFWRIRHNGRIPANKLAGYLRASCYWYIRINGKKYRRSRLTWIWHYGHIPEGYEIDHINRNRSDDRIENLRLVTSSQNSMNTNLRSDNKSGNKGVHWCGKYQKWRACIRINGKEKHLGYFEGIKESIAAREMAEKKYFRGYAAQLENRI